MNGVPHDVTALTEPAETVVHGTVITLGGESVRFLCDLPQGVRIVRAILGPYCVVEDVPPVLEDTDGWTVISSKVTDFARVTEDIVRRHGVAGGSVQPVRRWAGDDTADRYDFGAGHSVVVHRRPFVGLTVFARDARRIAYLRPDDAFNVPHTEHVIKYPLRVTLRQAGFGQVHAAGCSLRGRGLLIMGEKGSGKSTLLVQCMSRGARQTSNDLSFVRCAATGNEMIAFPHMTRVAAGTIADNKMLRVGLEREERTGDYLRSPVFNGGKEEFYFPVLERIWGKDPICRQVPLDVFVFPALDLGRTDSHGRPMSRGEIQDRVRDSLLNDPPLPDWLPFLSPQEFRSLAGAAADTLLRRDTMAYELRYGASGTDPVSELERILDLPG